jgi:FtsZ-binding cell division protein ZapB
MKPYWQRQEAIEDLEFEVVELREKNDELEGQIYELEKKCEEFDIGQRQLWESIDSAFGSINNMKGNYEKNKEKKE